LSATWKQWGRDIDEASIQQMKNACSLPIAVKGALMPDAHLGYGLPIGGVLGCRNAVIPYAVGVDIACRVMMTVFDTSPFELYTKIEKFKNAIEVETRFGIGASFEHSCRRNHPVMDMDWTVSPVTSDVKDKAWEQLGTSGSGNHFVEFGIISLSKNSEIGPPGKYVALLSHSGSRNPGHRVASHYSKLAMSLRQDLPKELRHLAWLDLDTQEGCEYWDAMQLMGHYASANHVCIHSQIVKKLDLTVVGRLENHHNFAWKEEHDGEELIVHRKGATPAGDGVLGIIPGSMASSTFIVKGKGNRESLNSAAHGAGRTMSRKQAKKVFNWNEVKKELEEYGVILISAGLDEAPSAYKKIEEVMEAQSDLVEPIAEFEPRLVKMAEGR